MHLFAFHFFKGVPPYMVLQNGMKPGFAEKQFFKLRKIVFLRTCLDCVQSDLEHCLPNNLVKRSTVRIKPSTFKTEVRHTTRYATGALL